jgi:hypothetical protein
MAGDKGKCCCVTSVECEAPANWPGRVGTRCYNCGDFVCRKCSTVRTERDRGGSIRKRRVCDRCLEEFKRMEGAVTIPLSLNGGILCEIVAEIERGEALHPNYRSADVLRRTALISEESGEALREALNATRPGVGETAKARAMAAVRAETIQTAAMAIRALNALTQEGS